jgi:hypothetical protein
MTDVEFALELRRAALAIASSLYKRYGWVVLLVILKGELEDKYKRCQQEQHPAA